MRPKFNADACYISLHDGVYLRSNSGRLMLKGKSLPRLLEHLIPLLNGNATLEDITEGLDTERKRIIINLIEKLLAHHFLRDTSQDQPSTLCPAVLETYASNITFIASFQPSAASLFERFRNKRLLLIGSGRSFTSLVQASLQCGVRQIDLIRTLESNTDASEMPDLSSDLFSRHDSEQIVASMDAPCWDDEVGVLNIIQAYDAILHISERPMLARAQLLNRLCVEQRKTLIQAIVVDDHAWIGPLVHPEAEGCWECAWRRLQSGLINLSEHLSHYKFHNQPATPLSRILTVPVATITANRLIFELFRHVTRANGIKSTETAGNLIDIDLGTFQSEGHAFLPHPHCLACQHPGVPTAAQFLEHIQQRQRQGPIELDAFFENMTRCVDGRLGLLTAIDSSKFVQVPLAVYEVKLSDPMLRECQNKALSVVAVGIDTANARRRAFQRACAYYAANLMDRRRLLSRQVIQPLHLSVLSTDQLIGTTPHYEENEMWTWALDLQTQQAHLVPATQVFGPLDHQTQGAECGRGIASGMIWEEAVCQALLDWCNYLAIGQLKEAKHMYVQVDLARTPMTPEGAHLYHLLQTTGEQITVYDVTGTLHVPTFATCIGEKVVAYSTHCDVALALEMGLEQALQQYQSEHCQQPEYAVAPVLDLPPTLRDSRLHVPCYALPGAWSVRLKWLVQQFKTNGLRIFVVPLDHDPSLTQILPYIVRVLLARTEVKNE